MDTTLRRRALRAGAILGIGTLALVLTGCSTELSLEEAQASPERVIETDRTTWGTRSWSYVDTAGNERALSEDCSGFLTGYCYTDPDHTVEFHYTISKGALLSESLIRSGVEQEADCVSLAFLDSTQVCAPITPEKD